jgi:hypothetical protein
MSCRVAQTATEIRKGSAAVIRQSMEGKRQEGETAVGSSGEGRGMDVKSVGQGQPCHRRGEGRKDVHAKVR